MLRRGEHAQVNYDYYYYIIINLIFYALHNGVERERGGGGVALFT